MPQIGVIFQEKAPIKVCKIAKAMRKQKNAKKGLTNFEIRDTIKERFDSSERTVFEDVL